MCLIIFFFLFLSQFSQGFASGDADRDAFALRYFVEQGLCPLLTQSFSKNMGLYGERVGLLSVVAGSAEEAAAIESQLKIIIRSVLSVCVCVVLAMPVLLYFSSL